MHTSARSLVTHSGEEWPESTAALQVELNRLERWAERNHLKFNKGNARSLRKNNPRHQDRYTNLLECTCEEFSGADNKLSMSQQCLWGKEAILLGRALPVGQGRVTATLLSPGSDLECCVQFEALQENRQAALGAGPAEPSKMIKGQEHLMRKG